MCIRDSSIGVRLEVWGRGELDNEKPSYFETRICRCAPQYEGFILPPCLVRRLKRHFTSCYFHPHKSWCGPRNCRCFSAPHCSFAALWRSRPPYPSAKPYRRRNRSCGDRFRDRWPWRCRFYRSRKSRYNRHGGPPCGGSWKWLPKSHPDGWGVHKRCRSRRALYRLSLIHI